MTAEQLRRRDALMDRLVAIAATQGVGASEPLKPERVPVVDELLALAKEADLTKGDPLERSRTWRFVASAYFDLGCGRDANNLELAKQALDHAEELLSGLDEPGERARLDTLYGTVLRGLSGGTDRALLEQAKLRFRLALDKLTGAPPQLATYVEQQLTLVQQQLVLAVAFARAAEGLDQLKRIEGVLTHEGAGATADSQRAAERMMEQFSSTHDLSALRDTAIHAVEAIAPVLPGSTGEIKRLLDPLKTFRTSKPLDSDAELGLAFVSMMRETFRSQVEQGRVKPARAQVLERLLEEIERLLKESPDERTSIEADVRWLGRLRELMSRSSSILRDASYASAPPAGSRGQVLLTFLEAQQQFVARETNRPNLPRGESQAGNELFSRLGSIGDNIAATAGNDAATTAIEREALRQAFLDIRRFARRRHLTIATPFWGQTPDSSNPNGIFFAGSDRYRDIVEQVCRARGLEMLDRKVGLEIGRDRWRDLASCSVGIFDLTVPRGRDLAAVCYDLGLSQGLGISPIVLSLPNLKVPFDVNVYEYRLDGAHDEDIVADALDDAQCAPPSSTAGSSIALTIDEVRRRAALVDTEGTDAVLQQQTLDALSRTDDAIEVARLIAYLPKNDPISLLLPAWPGGYPAPPKTRCFHVMPFGKRWSDAAMRAVESVCDDAKAKYVRGDTIADPDIIESIWNEITAATHVIVDVTSFNANVAMELGLAHALGRKVLLVAQGSGVEKRLWPSISKLRVEPYAVQPDMDSLRQCTRQFLSNRTFASSDRQILRASAGARPKR